MNKPEKIVLMRHGQSEGNLDPTLYTRMLDSDIPLSMKGELDVDEEGSNVNSLFDEFANLFVYVSTYKRTRQTFDAIKDSLTIKDSIKRILTIRYDPRIREHHWGTFTNMEQADICLNALNEDPLNYQFPINGESGLMVYDRCASFVETMFREYDETLEYKRSIDKDLNVLIVSHGYTIRILVDILMENDVIDLGEKRFLTNAETITLTLKNNKYIANKELYFGK